MGDIFQGTQMALHTELPVYKDTYQFDLTDRVAEQQVRDNAAFRLFCGYGLLKKWHAPDHTKIETFRSRH